MMLNYLITDDIGIYLNNTNNNNILSIRRNEYNANSHPRYTRRIRQVAYFYISRRDIKLVVIYIDTPSHVEPIVFVTDGDEEPTITETSPIPCLGKLTFHRLKRNINMKMSILLASHSLFLHIQIYVLRFLRKEATFSHYFDIHSKCWGHLHSESILPKFGLV